MVSALNFDKCNSVMELFKDLSEGLKEDKGGLLLVLDGKCF